MRSRLPERFSGKLPPLLVEAAIGILLPLVLTLVRIAILPWTDSIAPFALVFVAVIAATVLAGWRSGLLALIIGQLLAWYFIEEPRNAFGPLSSAQLGGLVLATIAQLVALVIITLYQREVALASSRREDQMGLIEKALKEIDHRTSNNYQTVLALVLAQAKTAEDTAVKAALQQVADRINAIAKASTRLAVASESLEQVRIGEHLRDLCDEVERGLSRPGVGVQCEFDDIVLDADDTTAVSILVNELVTNALKHAFPEERGGTIRVSLKRVRGGVELCVEDDGVGMAAAGSSRGGGLGQRLIDTFIKQLRGRHEVASDSNGTRHRVHIPS